MSKYHFTTVASSEYLFKMLVMYKSLLYHHKDFKLFVLCTDHKSYKMLSELKLDKMVPIKLETIEHYKLLNAKKNRSYMEYCWTCKPAVLYHVMKKYPNAQYFAHVDADLCFFSSIDAVFNEKPDSLAFITDHNNSNEFLNTYETSGRYNSGFFGCRNDPRALMIVQWWKEHCIEWCYVVPDVNKRLYGDQRFLEHMKERFDNIHVVKTKGANGAHWNIKGFVLSLRNGEVYLNEDKLIFYHFSGFSIMEEDAFNISWLIRLDDNIVNMIYLPYMKLLAETIKEIQCNYSGFDKGFFRLPVDRVPQYYKLEK